MNKAAEKLLGLPRVQIIGKSVRELFPAETAEGIERLDRASLGGREEGDALIQTVSTPNNGQRTVAVRRLHMPGRADESHMLIVMIEDRTTQVAAAA